MDDLVREAMARWPNVPAVCGWLRLDRRGRWMLVDRGQPGFDERLHGEGSPITNEQIVAFIGRNYLPDTEGRWFWQNGPQRVYVDLETAPLVLRVVGSGAGARLVTHTGAEVANIEDAWRSADGELMLATDLGPGAIHDLDLAQLALDEAPGEVLHLTLHGRTFTVRDRADGDLPFVRRPRA